MNTNKILRSVVIKNKKLSNKFHIISFKFESRIANFEPGQFLTLKVSKGIFRCYSIFSLPKDLPNWQVFVDITPGGPGTTYLKNLKKGDIVHTSNPTGFFTKREDDTENIIMASTGCGLAPLKSIIESILFKKNNGNKNIYLLWGLKSDDKFVLKEKLDKWSQNKNFHYLFCFSHDITKKLQNLLLKLPKNKTSVYLSGNGSFIQESTKELRESGVLEEHIYFEQCYFTV